VASRRESYWAYPSKASERVAGAKTREKELEPSNAIGKTREKGEGGRAAADVRTLDPLRPELGK